MFYPWKEGSKRVVIRYKQSIIDKFKIDNSN